jgi:hypothetical protein
MQQFKVGDWVRWKGSTAICKVLSDSIRDGSNHSVTKIKEGWKFTSNFELWQPKVGEWCLFWDYETDKSATLAKFDSVIRIEHTEDIPYTEVLYKSQENGLQRYICCEPFTDELPNFIKGRNSNR